MYVILIEYIVLMKPENYATMIYRELANKIAKSVNNEARMN